MNRKVTCVVAVCALLPLGPAYAGGPKYSVHHASEAAVSPDQGRIYFYRKSSLLGIAVNAPIRIDGQEVGESSSGDYFYVDRAPGTYTITAKTEKEETTTVTLAAGQTVYVKTSVSPGFFAGHIQPEVVSDDVAQSEIADCDFMGMGSSAPAPAATATTSPATPATPTAEQPAAAPAATGAPTQTSPSN